MSSAEVSPERRQRRSVGFLVLEIFICGIFVVGLFDPRGTLRIPAALALSLFILCEIGIHIGRRRPHSTDPRALEQGHALSSRAVLPDGPPEAVYRSASHGSGLVMVGLGLVFLGFSGWLWHGHLTGTLIIRGKAALLMWMGPFLSAYLWYIGLRPLLAQVTVAVYPEGFAYATASTVEFCAWDQVETVWQKLRRDQNNTVYRSYWVQRNDGKVFVFKWDRLEHFAALGRSIRERALPPLIAAAREAFDAGKLVEFGPVGVSQEGLTYKGQSLPWSEITELAADKDGDLLVKKRGRLFAWCELSTAHIPNFPVLLELLGPTIRVDIGDA